MPVVRTGAFFAVGLVVAAINLIGAERSLALLDVFLTSRYLRDAAVEDVALGRPEQTEPRESRRDDGIAAKPIGLDSSTHSKALNHPLSR